MSQIYKNSSGGGGGTPIETLTPDSGGSVAPINGNINVQGYLSGSSQVVETYKNGTNFQIADNSYITPYVVDSSTTPGSMGTYQTIQAALNQAVIDGMSYTNQKVIWIRTGTYVENLTIPGGAILKGVTLINPIGGVITPVLNTLIVGSHIFTGIVVWAANDIVFETNSGDLFNGDSSELVLGYLSNCFIIQAGSDQIINDMPSNSSFNFTNCTFGGGADTTQFTTTGMTSLSMMNCLFSQQLGFDIDGTALNLINCTGLFASQGSGIGYLMLSNGASVYAQSCIFSTMGDYCISGSGASPSEVYDCAFSAGLGGIQSTTGNWVIRNCSTIGNTVIPVYETGTALTINQCIQGNVITSTTTAADLNVSPSMYYIGVTSTSSAHTIYLPDGSGGNIAGENQLFIIKDESGGALVHNITITTAGGTKTIDGATSKTINTNYGVVTVRYNGINYFTI